MKTHYIFIIFITIILFTFSLKAQDDVFKVVEQMPVYGECINEVDNEKKKSCSNKAVMSFMYDNLVYPVQAQEKGIEGLVVLQFIIDENGNIQEPTVVKDIGDGCGDEALRVIQTMGKWTPGYQKGQAVKVQKYLPVKFKIIPVTVRSEVFVRLSDFICQNYNAEFIKADIAHQIANDEWVPNNVCGIEDIENSCKNLQLTVKKNGLPTSVKSEIGSFTESMRNLLRNVQKGDVIEFNYNMEIIKPGQPKFSQEVYKSIIVE